MLLFRISKGLSHIPLKGNVCGRLAEEDGYSALDKENHIKTITQPFRLSCFSTSLVFFIAGKMHLVLWIS